MQAIETDLLAAYDGDPAAGCFEEIILAYPGLMAVTVYRIAHELYLLQVPVLPRLMTEYAHSETGIDIHPGAAMGKPVYVFCREGSFSEEVAEILFERGAAFIMANGAASLGRKVTMFFTFWGLNILRRSEKVKVDKSFIEKMFGWMMPRGSQKLGLSRMNMLGAGGKMIRGIMKAKGISSLEELIEDARGHGVRLVACQMSMDVMGIKKEELIDGVELGGVATFIGSGETSDISLL